MDKTALKTVRRYFHKSVSAKCLYCTYSSRSIGHGRSVTGTSRVDRQQPTTPLSLHDLMHPRLSRPGSSLLRRVYSTMNTQSSKESAQDFLSFVDASPTRNFPACPRPTMKLT